MIKFNEEFLNYKDFIETNSKYFPKVVKNVSETETYFPIIDFKRQNSVNTDDMTVDRIEYYDRDYFEITIYTQDQGNISKNVIADELMELTHIYMGLKRNMLRTGCKPIPNIDSSILRTLMSYQCEVDNIYGRIIRR